MTHREPPAVRLLKAIFAAGEKRDREMAEQRREAVLAEDEQAEKHAATTVASASTS